MPEEKMMGVIYILTNPSFPEYVKIGYTKDLKGRLNALNSSSATPFAFRVYATYEVSSELSDRKLHSVIETLNPHLRARDTVDGKRRVREFFAMSPEDAFSILEAIATINGFTDRLKRMEPTEEEMEDEKAAETIARRSPFSFSACGILPGSVLEFWESRSGRTDIVCTVIDDRHVEYEGEVWTLSRLAGSLKGRSSIRGPDYFRFDGEWLTDIRDRCEGREGRQGSAFRRGRGRSKNRLRRAGPFLLNEASLSLITGSGFSFRTSWIMDLMDSFIGSTEWTISSRNRVVFIEDPNLWAQRFLRWWRYAMSWGFSFAE